MNDEASAISTIQNLVLTGPVHIALAYIELLDPDVTETLLAKRCLFKALLDRADHTRARGLIQDRYVLGITRVEMAVSLAAATKDPADIVFARTIVEDETGRYWSRPRYGVLHINTVGYYIQLWLLTKDDQDLAQARALCTKLKAGNDRFVGLSIIAKRTWSTQDVLATFRSASKISNKSLRDGCIDGFIMDIAIRAMTVNFSTTFVAMTNEVASQLGPHRKKALLKRLETYNL